MGRRISTHVTLLFVVGCLLGSLAPAAQAQIGTRTPPLATYDDARSAPQPAVHSGATPNRVGNSTVAPPEASDSLFVVDSGGNLDDYLFRQEVPDGKLTFTIPINRYYSSLITSASVENGFLKDAVLRDLIDKHLLPERATLTLQIYDVDHEVPEGVCEEVDHVYINGRQVQSPTGVGPARLTSGNNTWSTWSVSFPIGMLKFPTGKGENGQLPTQDNTVAIDINVLECLRDNEPGTAWAVEVDWGMIAIPSPIRPVLFAHGWTGSNDPNSGTFAAFEGFLQADGIPSAGQVDLEQGILPIAQTAPLLAAAINRATREYGVDKVNIFGHSKGGLVARLALRTSDVARRVDYLITFGSPHHGTNEPNLLVWVGLKCTESDYPDAQERQQCRDSADELAVARIRDEFNYRGCTWRWLPPGWTSCQPRYVRQPGVSYLTFVGQLGDIDDRSATYPWNANEVPYPSRAQVDASFGLLSHVNINTSQSSYRCAISKIDSRIHWGSNCWLPAATLAGASPADAPVWPDASYQTIAAQAAALPASTAQSFPVTVDSGAQALFTVLGSAPVTFTLVDPSGRAIDPAVADADPAIVYGAQTDTGFGSGWFAQYQVSSPAAGIWRYSLQSATPVTVSIHTSISSTLRLNYQLDRYTYRPGQPITLVAALDNNGAPVAGTAVSGTVTQPGGAPEQLTFYDDGTHGDVTAGDGLQTAQLTAAASTGIARFQLAATSGTALRTIGGGFAIAQQTAKFQGVIGETTSDANSNQLYDKLNITISLNVTQSRHFEVSGTLVDSSGQAVATATYSTRMAGTGSLPPGIWSIPLSFDGQTIRQRGANGPYTLTGVSVQDTSGEALEVDAASNMYTTAAYNARQFEGPFLALLKGSETTADTDKDGRIDELTISLDLDVVTPGAYSWNGRLVDSRGGEIGWYVGSGMLGSQQPMVFTFAGERIGANGQNGPYVLRDVSVYKTDGGQATALFETLYTTSAYNFMAFEGGIARLYVPLLRR